MAESKENLQTTALFETHQALGGRMVPFAGFQMPVQYEGVVKEHHAVRERAGIFDVSHMGELELRGKEAIAAADALVTNDVTTLVDGQALYTVCCNTEGRILDDLIVYRRGPEWIWIVCNASNHQKISAHLKSHAAGFDVSFSDLTAETSLLALQGPKAHAIATELGASFMTELSSFRLATGKIAGVECLAARTGYTGEDGFEVFCKNEHAKPIFDALMKAGTTHGVVPVGLGARDTLRLEAKLSLYGNEIDESTHPYEAGLGWVVKLDRGDFVGKQALAEIKAQGNTRRLVGFEMVERGIGRHGYPVLIDGEAKGVVTSGSPGPTVGKNIGLAYLPKGSTKVGTEFYVQIRRKQAKAIVVKTPFYRRPS